MVDAAYIDNDKHSSLSRMKHTVEEMEVEMPVEHVKKIRSLSHRSRSNTQRSRTNTYDGYHNPALVVDDVSKDLL